MIALKPDAFLRCDASPLEGGGVGTLYRYDPYKLVSRPFKEVLTLDQALSLAGFSESERIQILNEAGEAPSLNTETVLNRAREIQRQMLDRK